jgi:hypothetical protein
VNIYMMVSDDLILKPSVLFRILLRKANEVCGVAEVRDSKGQRTKKIIA